MKRAYQHKRAPAERLHDEEPFHHHHHHHRNQDTKRQRGRAIPRFFSVLCFCPSNNGIGSKGSYCRFLTRKCVYKNGCQRFCITTKFVRPTLFWFICYDSIDVCPLSKENVTKACVEDRVENLFFTNLSHHCIDEVGKLLDNVG